jgi:hypothetical protein
MRRVVLAVLVAWALKGGEPAEGAEPAKGARRLPPARLPKVTGLRTFSVKSYGAKGDGKADDTAAIQKALNAAKAAGGGVVQFPAGTYNVSLGHLKRTTWKVTLGTPRPPKGGTWALSFGGRTTEPLRHDAPADKGDGNVQAALARLSSAGGGKVKVTGGAAGAYTVTLDGSLVRGGRGLTGDGSRLAQREGSHFAMKGFSADGKETLNGPMLACHPNVHLRGVIDPDADGNPKAWRSTLRVADYQGDYLSVLGVPNYWGDLTGFTVDGLAFDGNRAKNPTSYLMSLHTDPHVQRIVIAVGEGRRFSCTRCLFHNVDTYNCVSLFTYSGPLRDCYVGNNTARDLGNPDWDHDTSFFRVSAHDCLLENNQVFGNADRKAVWAAYEVRGSNNVLRNNFADACLFGCLAVGTGEFGRNQRYERNTFTDVLAGFALRPFYAGKAPATMENVVMAGNTVGVNQGIWTSDLKKHPMGTNYQAAFDLLAHSVCTDQQPPRDGGTVSGLVLKDNTVTFKNMADAGAVPHEVFRLVRSPESGKVGQGKGEVTVRGLVITGNKSTGCPSKTPLNIGPLVRTPGAVISGNSLR